MRLKVKNYFCLQKSNNFWVYASQYKKIGTHKITFLKSALRKVVFWKKIGKGEGPLSLFTLPPGPSGDQTSPQIVIECIVTGNK